MSIVGAATSGTTGTILVITTAITALGVIGAAVLTVWDRRTSTEGERRDALLTYRRNIYRNFLDHAYWYRRAIDDKEKQKRAEKYVADWHRIQLIADAEVRTLTEPWREEGSLTPEDEAKLIEAFKRELELGGLE